MDKEQLYQYCLEQVNKKATNLEEALASFKKSLMSETKSSAGDKHETGRAMIQLEMEKAGKQLLTVQQMKEMLGKIDVSKSGSVARQGSVVFTSTGNYFLSVSLGPVKIKNQQYFAISTASPIGQLLLGKKEGDVFLWKEKETTILKIK